MKSGAPSLLSHLDAPIVVGDPEGRTAYVNPAFESAFSVQLGDAAGEPLANLFEGGAREAVLRAVAEACDRGDNVRFRIRQGDAGFSAVASPIVHEDARVGVVILMVEAAASDERFLSLYREVAKPLDALVAALDDILGQIRGRRAEHYRSVIEGGLNAINRLRRWSDQKYGLLAGGAKPGDEPESGFDVGRIVAEIGEQLADEFARHGVRLEVQAPSGLPPAVGEAPCLEQALLHLLRQRLESAPQRSTVTLAARRGPSNGVLILIADPGRSSAASGGANEEPELVLELVRDLGGAIRTSSDPLAGRTTCIRLDAA